ncbi:hypothetical protein DEF24_17915 [Marinitenerispora sediminis]|uniref:Uncharacterized protein n=1 Tax=Marinitenerispora sediminis TaxID=1931232 RepID=A0A368T297_9ACTN|nr:hypothetical protein DEF24_17915 [Marinitenerispora sediminis]
MVKRRSDVRVLLLALLFIAHVLGSLCHPDTAAAATREETAASTAASAGLAPATADAAEPRHQCEFGSGIGVTVDKRGIVKFAALLALGVTAFALIWSGPAQPATMSPPSPHAAARGGTRLLRTLCVQRV